MNAGPLIHPKADVCSKNIGTGTRIWQFAVVLENATIGADCNINCHTFIENDVKLGDHITVKSGVYLWDGITVEDHVFIGPNATFTNDKTPRSKSYPASFNRILIRRFASIGANATIIGPCEIGEYAMIGAGSVVTRSVPPYALVAGNPAQIIGFVEVGGEKMTKTAEGYLSADGRLFRIP